MKRGDVVIGRQSAKFINKLHLSTFPLETLTSHFAVWRRDENGKSLPYERLPSGTVLVVLDVEPSANDLSTGPKVKVMAPTGGIYWVLGCNLEPLETIDEAR